MLIVMFLGLIKLPKAFYTNVFKMSAMHKNLKIVLLCFEFAIIFLALPVLYLMFPILPKIPLLLLMTMYCFAAMIIDKKFPIGSLMDGKEALKKEINPIMKRFVFFALLIAALVFAFRKELLFSFPLQNVYLWVGVMLLYPIFSAYPQELIYRSFFFWRYKQIFKSKFLIGMMSAWLFAFMHIVYFNPVAILFSLIGGIIFARTYARTNSLLIVAFEHALYGAYIFTIGLGVYFYSGM